MNHFAGSIRFYNNQENNIAWLNTLSRDFPDYFRESVNHPNNVLALYGNSFTTSLLYTYHSELYLHGALSDKEELAQRVRMPLEVYDHDAALIHTLILETGIHAVDNLKGNYLIVYYNEQLGKVYLINRYPGNEQIIFYKTADTLLFASDIKLLAVHPLLLEEKSFQTEVLSGICEVDIRYGISIINTSLPALNEPNDLVTNNPNLQTA